MGVVAAPQLKLTNHGYLQPPDGPAPDPRETAAAGRRSP